MSDTTGQTPPEAVQGPMPGPMPAPPFASHNPNEIPPEPRKAAVYDGADRKQSGVVTEIVTLINKHFDTASFETDLQKRFKKTLEKAELDYDFNKHKPAADSREGLNLQKQRENAKSFGLYGSIATGVMIGVVLATIPLLSVGVLGGAAMVGVSAVTTNLAIIGSAVLGIGSVALGVLVGKPVGEMMAKNIKPNRPTFATVVTEEDKKGACEELCSKRGAALAEDIRLVISNNVTRGVLTKGTAAAVLDYIRDATPAILGISDPPSPTPGPGVIEFNATKMLSEIIREARTSPELNSLRETYVADLKLEHERNWKLEEQKKAKKEKKDPLEKKQRDLREKTIDAQIEQIQSAGDKALEKEREANQKQIDDLNRKVQSLSDLHKSELAARDAEIRALTQSVRTAESLAQTMANAKGMKGDKTTAG